MENFLRTGIPLAKADSMQQLHEENSLRLAHSPHLSEYIPIVHKHEQMAIREEIKEDNVFFFGDTTLSEEAVPVIICFCKAWKVQRRLFELQILAKLLNREELPMRSSLCSPQKWVFSPVNF